ncbi:Hypothetical_protein [Hexamita inflata]|uniref:Hypothetical_protein n=1 Tax=Hexamita inflata TaxID=28002 RepID=A0ABP1HBE7_9EUKA
MPLTLTAQYVVPYLNLSSKIISGETNVNRVFELLLSSMTAAQYNEKNIFSCIKSRFIISHQNFIYTNNWQSSSFNEYLLIGQSVFVTVSYINASRHIFQPYDPSQVIT